MLKKNVLLDIEFILKKIPKKNNLQAADFGCGNFGYFVFPLARFIGRKGTVYAVDVLKSSLDEIKRKAHSENLSQVKTVWSNLEIVGATKINDDSLDVALLINTLHQAVKSLDMLKEIARMIKPNGILIVVDWDSSDSPLGPPLNQRIRQDRLAAAAARLGLEIEEEFTPGAYHYGLIFKKL